MPAIPEFKCSECGHSMQYEGCLDGTNLATYVCPQCGRTDLFREIKKQKTTR